MKFLAKRPDNRKYPVAKAFTVAERALLLPLEYEDRAENTENTENTKRYILYTFSTQVRRSYVLYFIRGLQIHTFRMTKGEDLVD